MKEVCRAIVISFETRKLGFWCSSSSMATAHTEVAWSIDPVPAKTTVARRHRVFHEVRDPFTLLGSRQRTQLDAGLMAVAKR